MGDEAQESDSESDGEDQAGRPEPASASDDQDGHLLLMPRSASEGGALATPMAPTAAAAEEAEGSAGGGGGAIDESDLTTYLAQEVLLWVCAQWVPPCSRPDLFP